MAKSGNQEKTETNAKGGQREAAAYITSKDSLDGAYPGIILGINSRRLGMEATVFYTFMGINVIRKG